MKLLVLGIDGGDIDIINAMDMPFTQKLISERTSIKIREDLWSRGWSEIASGLHGVDTGAFYAKPKLDGTSNFTQSYNYDDYKKNPNCILIWEKLNMMGYKVGFINMPTTIPVPKVDGFFISGAGSGFSPSSRVPEVACYPKEIAYDLLKVDYIWEQRFNVSGIRDFDLFIERCIKTVIQRTELFIKLSKKFEVDVGFIMHREFSTLTNLFANLIQPAVSSKGSNKRAQIRLSHFYRVLDDFINVAINELDPNHIVIVSDHSVSDYEHSMNLNDFLCKNDFLINQKRPNSKRSLKSRAQQYVMEKIRRKIIPGYRPKIQEWQIEKIDFDKTTAFSNNYIPGIYLNDERFLNKVSSAERDHLVNNIIEMFNKTEEAKNYNLMARPYKEFYSERFAYNLLPDIWIDIPDTIFPEQKGAFIQRNPYYVSYEDLSLAPRDLLTGIKGRKALCCIEKEFGSALDLTSTYDLTVTYQLILNHFKH
jgi:predicted AlkP superfamily phosphohydrolase/phosphomutase